jgi:hypothetical protein
VGGRREVQTLFPLRPASSSIWYTNGGRSAWERSRKAGSRRRKASLKFSEVRAPVEPAPKPLASPISRTVSATAVAKAGTRGGVRRLEREAGREAEGRWPRRTGSSSESREAREGGDDSFLVTEEGGWVRVGEGG